MNKTTDPLAWAALAEEDYLLPRSALRRKEPLRYGACFHAQQCAEKYLKATLVLHEKAFPKTHDLLALSDLCAQTGILVPIAPDELDRLSAYAVQVRYPGDEPTLEAARHAMEVSKAVRRFVRGLLGIH